MFLSHSQRVLRTRVSCQPGLCLTYSGSLTAGSQDAGGSCQPGHGPTSPRKLTVGPEEAVGSCQPRRSLMCPEAKVQVLRRTWPHIFLCLTIRLEEPGSSCQHGRGPKSSRSSQCILRRLETPVSVDSASTSSLGLTTGSDKAGVFCLHGRISIFPEDYTGGPEDISVWLCGHGPTSS